MQKIKSLVHYVVSVVIILSGCIYFEPSVSHAQSNPIYVQETDTPRECESLMPLTQPSALGNSTTVSSTYWVLNVNFQSLGLYPEGPGVVGCLKILGRDPDIASPRYKVLYRRYVDCIFSTRTVLGVAGWNGAVWNGQGTVTYGNPTLDASQYGGTGTGRWQPVSFSGGAYLRCPNVDLKGWIDYEQLFLPNSTRYATLDQVQPLMHFSMAAFGSVSAQAKPNSKNPLITYVPGTPSCGAPSNAARGCGMNTLSVPGTSDQNMATISSRFNGQTTSIASLSFLRTSLQYWHSEFNSVGTTTTAAPVIQSRYDVTSVPLSAPAQAPVTVTTLNPGYFRFWTGPSTLYIGKDPNVSADSFVGTLYEAIVDPSGDSRPPQ